MFARIMSWLLTQVVPIETPIALEIMNLNWMVVSDGTGGFTIVQGNYLPRTDGKRPRVVMRPKVAYFKPFFLRRFKRVGVTVKTVEVTILHSELKPPRLSRYSLPWNKRCNNPVGMWYYGSEELAKERPPVRSGYAGRKSADDDETTDL